jgi:hypothetical protein
MKLPVLSGFALLCATTALAQVTPILPPPTTPAPTATQPPQAITMTGCVGGGTNSQPYMLNNAMVLPQTGAAATGGGTAAATPPTSAATPPPSAATPPPSAATPPASAATPPAAAATPPSTVGSTGIAGPPGTAGAAATTGTVGATPPAGAGASAIGAYRLSGTDMSGWAGQRVQIVGTVIPPSASAVPGTTPVPEFRVQSVQPVTGPCPQQ